MSAEPITPYACSRGLVIAHQDEPPAYHIRNAATGQVEGHPANGAPSPDNVESDIANPPAQPPAPVVLTPLTVLSRLTPAEEAAFQTSADMAVAIVRGRFTAAQEIRTDDARTVEGIQILIAKGIITMERAAAIFAP